MHQFRLFWFEHVLVRVCCSSPIVDTDWLEVQRLPFWQWKTLNSSLKKWLLSHRVNIHYQWCIISQTFTGSCIFLKNVSEWCSVSCGATVREEQMIEKKKIILKCRDNSFNLTEIKKKLIHTDLNLCPSIYILVLNQLSMSVCL